MKYTIVLTTVASITVEVEADGEDAALEQAYQAASDFGNQMHVGTNWSADLNETWQLNEPEIRCEENA